MMKCSEIKTMHCQNSNNTTYLRQGGVDNQQGDHLTRYIAGETLHMPNIFFNRRIHKKVTNTM